MAEEDNFEIHNPATGSRSNNQNEDESNVVRLKLPPFWIENPEIWFFQIEAQFFNERVRSETSKFNQLVANLEPKFLENIWDIITSDDTAKYSAAKIRLLNILKERDVRQLKKLLAGLELGDMKPSQLLRKMQSLAGSEVTQKALKTLWLDTLPNSV